MGRSMVAAAVMAASLTIAGGAQRGKAARSPEELGIERP